MQMIAPCVTVFSISLKHVNIPKRQFLHPFKPKELADDNFKFDENSRKLIKGVENTVGKGEIACYEQFLVFPQCFQKTWVADM